MNIIFMGTPDFAVPSLRALEASQHTVVAVVTGPDRKRGRGQKLTFTPVKQTAMEFGIPLLQPESVRDPDFAQRLREIPADLFVVVAFRILPAAVFTLPRLGTFNLHASLLPRYRGAAPINRALMNGDRESGVTTFFIREKVDTGNLILQKSVPLSGDMTAGDLHDILADMGATCVVETVTLIDDDRADAKQQHEELATPAPKIFREDCVIDWSRPADEVHNHIRGLSPYPAAWTRHGAKLLKIYRSRIPAGEEKQAGKQLPGTIMKDDHKLHVACGSGMLEILQLKQEGRKQLDAEEFMRGYDINAGDVFTAGS